MITTAIVGHIDRVKLISKLIYTAEPTYLTIDDGQRGHFVNHMRAWTCLARANRSEWSVVLEDDALPVQCFKDQLQQALSVAPSPVVSLYLGTDRPRDIQPAIRARIREGVESCWITAQRMLHAVGIAIRTELIPGMLEHITQPPAVFMPIDNAIGCWANSEGIDVAYTWPSLVDHADVETVIDMHDDGHSRAKWIEGEHGMPILQQRRAWNVGIRARWDSSSIGLETNTFR
jgi:hypothetical protein